MSSIRKRGTGRSGRVRESIPRITADVARKLGYYVYVYIDPLDGKIFYVGKGKGQRLLSHLDLQDGSRKAEVLNRIRAAGKEPYLEILAHGMKTQEMALRVEAAAIDALGLPALTNRVRGWKSLTLGRQTLRSLIAQYRKRAVKVTDPAVLIRVNRLYRPTMTPLELYDATRGVWKVGPRRERARYALAVFEGVVLEVYEIRQWFPAGSTFTSRDREDVRVPGRWEFIGCLAPGRIRRRYIDRHVGSYFTPGAQNPIAYVNVE